MEGFIRPSHKTNNEDKYTAMFKATLKGSTFQDMLEPVDALVDECKIHLNEDGLVIRAVDPANVGMVDFQLESAAFESYEADSGVIGVNLTRLGDIAGMTGTDDNVHFELDESTRKLHIKFDGLSYTLALIDPDSIRQEPDIPDLDLSATVTLESAQFNRAMTAADMVSDHVSLRVDDTDDTFVVEAEGDTDDVSFELDRDDLIDLQAAPAHSLFSLDYLKDMNKSVPSGVELELNLGEEFPMKLFYDIADGNGHVVFMLAPRIQSD